MRLTVATPMRVAVARDRVVHVRASDSSGAFGIQPGHADFLTALSVCVVHWRDDTTAGYVAVRGGVLRVSGGDAVDIGTREAVAGGDLDALEREVLLDMRRRHRAERDARRTQLHMEIDLLRRLYEHLNPPAGGAR